MPRQTSIAVDNNFKQGLVTQATGLNFPENACTETFDCEFNFDGSVSRRLGFDFEQNFTTQTIDRANKAVSTYLWKNVSGDGNVTVVVVQVGLTIYFYRLTAGASFSSGSIISTISLTTVVGAPDGSPIEVQYSDGNGLLFITHPYCDPIRVSYNISTDVATATTIVIKIRDFEGAAADPFAVDFRSTDTVVSLNVNHLYNLFNQGWTFGALTAWDTAQTTMPSNSDIMWRFRNATNDIDFSTASLGRVITGNTPAPKGHFVLTLSNQDRDGAAGTTGVAGTSTTFHRPSTSVFFAGRVFYAGINFVGFNSKIYFTQIIERPDQYNNCYQLNDPTSENLFDLLPSDGGVISIPDAGTVYKLVVVPGGLAAFAANGVWFISGSSGIGFTANDYTVQRVALIPTLSATSFVNIQGIPAWWNAEGIYILSYDQGGTFGMGSQLPSVKSLTYSTIKGFYDSIPLNSKRYARGAYDRLNGRIRWIYRGTDTIQVTNIYEFDRVLNINVNTGAFYPWTVSDSPVKINSMIIADTLLGTLSTDNVVDLALNNVVDLTSNQVITFTSSGLESSPFDKYLVSYPSAGSYKVTFADKLNADYKDWFSFDFVGVDFTSYFITGYKLRGDAIRKFQNNWVRIYSKLISDDVSYYFQGLWDFAKTGSGTGRWSVKQLVQHAFGNYSNNSARLKVRGNGLALQFRVESLAGLPFELIGWSAAQSTNQIP